MVVFVIALSRYVSTPSNIDTILPLRLSSSTVGVPSFDEMPSGITNIDEPTDNVVVVVAAIPKFISNF